jgi:hypothetical protein
MRLVLIQCEHTCTVFFRFLDFDRYFAFSALFSSRLSYRKKNDRHYFITRDKAAHSRQLHALVSYIENGFARKTRNKNSQFDPSPDQNLEAKAADHIQLNLSVRKTCREKKNQFIPVSKVFENICCVLLLCC